MTRPPELPPGALPLVGRAVQDLAAARLGRAFIPLGIVFLVGLGEMLTGAGGWELAGGAPLAAAAMLAHGLRVVQRAFGRPERAWMVLSPVLGVLPLGLGLYVLGWRGLRALSAADGIPGVVSGVFLTVVGLWVLRAWAKLLELASLADTMVMGDGTGGDR
jgi:hypothetical protein